MYVDGPGIIFWMKNFYELENIKLNQEFEKIRSSETKYFTLNYDEKETIEDSTLTYSLHCSSFDNFTNFFIG